MICIIKLITSNYISLDFDFANLLVLKPCSVFQKTYLCTALKAYIPNWNFFNPSTLFNVSNPSMDEPSNVWKSSTLFFLFLYNGTSNTFINDPQECSLWFPAVPAGQPLPHSAGDGRLLHENLHQQQGYRV